MRWAELHVDDVVLGADHREYRVVERKGGMFKLRRDDGHEVRCSPPPDTRATLVRRGNHTAEAAAFNVLTGAGFTVEILGESRNA